MKEKKFIIIESRLTCSYIYIYIILYNICNGYRYNINETNN